MDIKVIIVRQCYGNESFQAITLQEEIRHDVQVSISGSEHWLHMITQLIDDFSYLHSQGILHNDIKNDKIVVVCSANGLFCPVFTDFGKSCLVNEGKRKSFLEIKRLSITRNTTTLHLG